MKGFEDRSDKLMPKRSGNMRVLLITLVKLIY